MVVHDIPVEAMKRGECDPICEPFRRRSRHATTALRAFPIASDTVTSKAAEFRWESERDIEKGGRERYASASRSKLQFNDGHLVSRLLSSYRFAASRSRQELGLTSPTASASPANASPWSLLVKCNLLKQLAGGLV